MTVAENIGFNLRVKRRPKKEIKERVAEAARLLDLEPYLERKPAKLSGGQRQRVAMGRAIVRQPAVFLMDEPLSNLDAKLRVATRTQIGSLQRRLGITTVYVTHDQVEAMTLGDRVAVLRDGILQQCDTPHELFARPGNAFVAGFIGSPAMNLIDLPLSGTGVQLGSETIELTPAQRSALQSGRVLLGVRPEAFAVSGDGSGLEVTVEVVEELGADAYAFITADIGGTPQTLTVRVDPASVPARGAKIRLHIRRDQVHLFDAAGGARLPA
jgi:multiple sugar transport system ATP-binding protein